MILQTGVAPRVKSFVISLFLAPLLEITSASAATDRVGDFVNDYLKRKQVPGCAVMLRHNGKVALLRGYGIANIETRGARHAADVVSIRLNR